MAQRTNSNRFRIEPRPISTNPGARKALNRFLRSGHAISQIFITPSRKFLTGIVAILIAVAPHVPAQTGATTFAQLSQQADHARDAENLDQAVGLYRQALALRPQWVEGWWSLGTIYYD